MTETDPTPHQKPHQPRRRTYYADTSHWSRESLAWLAGILEGEGCFRITEQGTITIVLDMTDEDVVRRAHRVAGVGHLHGPLRIKGGNQKDSWRLIISYSDHTYALCAAILPFMGERRSARMTEMLKHFAGRARLFRKRLRDRPRRFIACGPAAPI